MMTETAGKKPKSTRARKQATGSQSSPEGLVNEIAMLRWLMQRVTDLVDEHCELGELLEVLEKVGRAQTRLVTLLKAQQTLGGEESLTTYINRALNELNQELDQDLAARRGR